VVVVKEVWDCREIPLLVFSVEVGGCHREIEEGSCPWNGGGKRKRKHIREVPQPYEVSPQKIRYRG